MNFVLKLSGCILMITATTLIGFVISKQLKSRCEFLTSFIDFLNNLETNIRFSGEDIFSMIKKSVNSKYLDVFIFEENSVEELWTDAINKIPRSYGLKNDDYNLLRDFGKMLGTTDTQGQISHIELYNKLFSSQLIKAETEYNSKSKLYKSLSFYAGVAIAVIII